MTERMTSEERYLNASNSSDLSVFGDRFTDADSLLAAAYAVHGDPRRNLALRVWRLLSCDMNGSHQVADELGDMLRKSIVINNPGRPRGHRSDSLRRIEAVDIAMQLLKWWNRPTCPECNGRGHPLIDGTPVLNLAEVCPACNGTKKIPLSKLFKPEQLPYAEWLHSEMEGLASMLFYDMTRLMRKGSL